MIILVGFKLLRRLFEVVVNGERDGQESEGERRCRWIQQSEGEKERGGSSTTAAKGVDGTMNIEERERESDGEILES